MKLASFILSALFLMSSSFASTEAKTTITIDTKASQVKWLGSKKITKDKHNGTIALKKGELVVEKNTIKSGEFEIDMNSIANQDLTDSTYNQKLINHLKSDDFFNAEKFPVATFKVLSSKEKKAKGATHEITGELTIKGVTQKVTFPANVEIKDGKFSAKATLKIDRTKWNIKYGSGKFFKSLGDKVINDEIEFDLDLSGSQA